MATVKGPQIYLNSDDHAEAEIIKWAETLGKGRKSMATIEAVIAGRAIARVCQPLADLLISAARRGESLTLDQVDDYVQMFKAHGKGKPNEPQEAKEPQPEPMPQESKSTPEKAGEEPQEEQLEIEEAQKTGFDSLGG